VIPSEAQNRVVFLVGFMGAGKTSVGRILAAQLGWEFVDLDELIEQREGRAVAEIFRDSGEPAFRDAETSALSDLLADLAGSPKIVALGGGAFVQPRNAQLLTASGVPVVFLDASVEELRRRCEPAAGTRPLFQDEAQFRRLYESRREAYLNADVRVETAGRSLDAVAEEVMMRLNLAAEASRE
jgi:shikimate kinase